MPSRRFIQADVFSTTPTKGNGLAVIVEAEGLTDAQMQEFAAWTNQAETTFLLPPTDPAADYRVRIFTPGREMPFAGHPTLGSCAAWLHCGGVPKTPGLVMQECAIGLVPILTEGAVPAFVAPPTQIDPMPDAERARICAALNLPDDAILNATRLTNGPVWHLLELTDADAVLEVDSALVRWPDFVGVSLIGAHPKRADFDYEVRNISPSSGMSEDPITGSLNAAIAHWLHGQGRLERALIVRQGTGIGREGRVHITRDEQGQLLIGGHSTIVIDGTVTL